MVCILSLLMVLWLHVVSSRRHTCLFRLGLAVFSVLSDVMLALVLLLFYLLGLEAVVDGVVEVDGVVFFGCFVQ